MPASVAYAGRGCKLNLQTATSPVTWTAIAQIQKIAFSGIKINLDDITNLDSPSAFKEWLATGPVDPGDVTFSGVLNPASITQGDMLSLIQAMTLSNFQITLSDAVTKLAFSGYFSEYSPVANIEPSKAITFSAKIQITGTITMGS
jgi:hypothetical protein